MTMMLLGKITRAAVVTVIASMGAYSPVLAQSETAVCMRAASEICGRSIEGYPSYAVCFREERQACLDGIPSGPPKPDCEPNDFACGLY